MIGKTVVQLGCGKTHEMSSIEEIKRYICSANSWSHFSVPRVTVAHFLSKSIPLREVDWQPNQM
jgi:hypothetical protein